jgi:hypothetical protein
MTETDTESGLGEGVGADCGRARDADRAAPAGIADLDPAVARWENEGGQLRAAALPRPRRASADQSELGQTPS